MPGAYVKKLNHRWIVGGTRRPENRVWERRPLAPCPGNQTTASQRCVHWVSFEVRFSVSDGPHLCPTMSRRTWRYTSLKVSATCQHCRTLCSNAEQISRDLLGCPEKSAVFAVRPPWMNDFLSLFSDKTGNWMAVTLSCVLSVSYEGQEERAALQLGSIRLCRVVKCSSSTSKLASGKRAIRQV